MCYKHYLRVSLGNQWRASSGYVDWQSLQLMAKPCFQLLMLLLILMLSPLNYHRAAVDWINSIGRFTFQHSMTVSLSCSVTHIAYPKKLFTGRSDQGSTKKKSCKNHCSVSFLTLEREVNNGDSTVTLASVFAISQ